MKERQTDRQRQTDRERIVFFFKEHFPLDKFFHGSHFTAEATACQLKNISMSDSWCVENSFNDYYAKWHADGVE